MDARCSKAATSLGFKAQGLAVSFEQLSQLQVPVIVYLQLAGKTHFTVILRTSKDFVLLGDPSWGNRLLTKTRFLTFLVNSIPSCGQGRS
jgi:predicted double-glycine peptidase